MFGIVFGNALLKIVVCIQICLSTWGYLGIPGPFISVTYSYIHMILLMFGALSITKPGSSGLVLMGQWQGLLCHFRKSMPSFRVLSSLHIAGFDVYFVINIFTILNDIILLGLFQPIADDAYEHDNVPSKVKNTYRFALGMVIVHLLLKPLICFVLYKIYIYRGGDLRAELLSIRGGDGGRMQGYDSVDEIVETASPHQRLEDSESHNHS